MPFRPFNLALCMLQKGKSTFCVVQSSIFKCLKIKMNIPFSFLSLEKARNRN